MFRWIVCGVLCALSCPVAAMESSAGQIRVDAMVTGLDEPWAVGVLPGGGVVITERDGRLIHVEAGIVTPVSGVPQVAATGQGGLLDVLVPRDFEQTREIFLSFSAPQGRRAGTALARGVLSRDGIALNDVEIIFEMERGSSGGQHFGSRIVEGRDGFLYLSIGDRGDRPSAQDLSIEAGSIVRVARDGSIPPDNPFVDQPGAQPEIWSYGHRNPQGMTLAPDGTILTAEHGARGGDEINALRKGANFGWPVISYGRHYSGARIGEGTEKAGMEQPEFYWDPSIAPSGIMVYSGALWPEWRGDVFVGSLKFNMISRLERGSTITEVERLQSDETQRVRDVREGPNGAIWFLSVGNGALYRMTPG